jgi:tetratricopeptide (TPR) repeat protein
MVRRAVQQARNLPAIPPDIGLRIRAARQERGLSLAKLGGEDLTRGFLSAVENGRSGISIQALSLVAERLDLPISHFLGDGAELPEGSGELLLDEAEMALRSYRPADALRLVNEAGEVRLLRSRTLWLRGWALTELARPREAISVLEQAVPLAEKTGDRRHVVQVLHSLAVALSAAGNNAEALTTFERAHAIAANELEDQALLGRITVCIGHLQYARGEYNAASAQYRRARELFAGIDDFDNVAAVYAGLSRVLRQQGDLKGALRYSRMSLGIFDAQHNERSAAKELSQMAARYGELGDTDQALATARDAVRRAQAAGAPDIEALARSTLASVYLQLDRLDDARTEAEAAGQLGLREQDIGFGDSLLVLARVAERTGDTARADDLYHRAIETFGANGFTARSADVALAYSEALKTRGELQRALEYALIAARSLSSPRV